MDREEELSLLERVRNGDSAAFDKLYDVYRARIFSFLLRMSRSRTVAEDLLEDTWLRFVSHARTLRNDTNLGAWLFTVARNLYWSHRRSCVLEEMRDSELLALWPPAAWPSPFELAAASELERRVEAALADLPPQSREVLLLVAHQGLTAAEAAIVCGITPEALRQRLSRARAMLAERLQMRPARTAGKRRYGT